MDRDRAVKAELNEQFARIGRALANPHRLELLDLLAQGERHVEALAAEAAMSVGLTSAHLSELRAARLVETRRSRTRILYRLADDGVFALLTSLRAAARRRLPEVQQAAAAHLEDGLEPVTREELLARAQAGSVVVIDVRPAAEFRAGHVPGALSLPIDELEDRLSELTAETDIVAYCRGPYCLYAATAVARLRGAGLRARRLIDGFPEWRMAGFPIATGDAA